MSLGSRVRAPPGPNIFEGSPSHAMLTERRCAVVLWSACALTMGSLVMGSLLSCVDVGACERVAVFLVVVFLAVHCHVQTVCTVASAASAVARAVYGTGYGRRQCTIPTIYRTTRHTPTRTSRSTFWSTDTRASALGSTSLAAPSPLPRSI